MNGIQSVSFLSKLNLYVTMEMYVFGCVFFGQFNLLLGVRPFFEPSRLCSPRGVEMYRLDLCHHDVFLGVGRWV